MMRPISIALAAGILAAVGLTAPSHSFAESSYEQRSSDAAGVRVVVTPKLLGASAKVWEFEVAMDTHVKPLADDLTAASVLVDKDGQRTKPMAWQGDPPGGHHRKGVLQFAAPSKTPKVFELQLTGVGGADLRTFRWELK